MFNLYRSLALLFVLRKKRNHTLKNLKRVVTLPPPTSIFLFVQKVLFRKLVEYTKQVDKKCFVYGILDLLFLEGDSITVWHVKKALKVLSKRNVCSAKLDLFAISW